MRLGIGVPISGAWATADNQVRLVRLAEDLGYHSVWTLQRLLVPEPAGDRGGEEVYRDILDPVIPLAYLAGQTTTIRLGTAVLNAPFFAPTVMAKQLTTLDILSGGRLDVGLGAGWSEPEFRSTGTPMAGRGPRLTEFVQVLKALWTESVVEFSGTYYEVPAARVEPKPVQRPHPPILLGGTAEPALRRAGRIADGWISSSRHDLTQVGAAVTTIHQAASDAGRDPEGLRIIVRGAVRVRPAGQTVRRMLTGSVDEIRGDLDKLREQGVTETFLDFNYDPEIGSRDADPESAMTRAEETLTALATSET